MPLNCSLFEASTKLSINLKLHIKCSANKTLNAETSSSQKVNCVNQPHTLRDQIAIHTFEPFCEHLIVVQSSNELHPRNCINPSNNMFIAQLERIGVLEVRVGQSFGFRKTLYIESFHLKILRSIFTNFSRLTALLNFLNSDQLKSQSLIMLKSENALYKELF